MFETLDDQIRRDANLETTRVQRVLRWVLALAVTVLVLGGLVFGVRSLG
jgi:cell division septal protein FtsQ